MPGPVGNRPDPACRATVPHGLFCPEPRIDDAARKPIAVPAFIEGANVQ